MNRDKIIVSGVNGFVGHHLTKELASLGASVIGIGREDSASDDIGALLDDYYKADLAEEWPEIPNVKAIIHLAGLATVGLSFDNPQLFISKNSAMVTNMCEYYVKQDNKPRIVMVSSGTVYDSNQPMPVSEDSNIAYTSPYTVSKVLIESQAKYYRSRGLDCVVARPFNHIGPGQDKGFILPDLYSRLSSLSSSEHKISVGNIKTRRDYTDVRDIVRAYGMLALSLSLQHDTYNICSGKSLSGADIFEQLTTAMNMPDVTYEIDQSLVRPTDIMEIVGNSSRLQDELGWKPTHPIKQTIIDFIESKSN